MNYLAGKPIVGIIGNSPGPRKTVTETERLFLTAAAAVTFGTITLEPREGNSGEVFRQTEQHTFNAIGMANRGLEHYLPYFQHWAAHRSTPLIVSIAGETVEEYAILANRLAPIGAALEVNLSCPNGGGDPLYLDIRKTAHILRRVREYFHGDLIVKVGYHPSVEHHRSLAALIGNYKASVALINTLALADGPRARLDAPYVGMSGPAILPLALGTVRLYRALLPDAQIIGEGGITSGEDIHAFVEAALRGAAQARSMRVEGRKPSPS